jgi:signal peptidase I
LSDDVGSSNYIPEVDDPNTESSASEHGAGQPETRLPEFEMDSDANSSMDGPTGSTGAPSTRNISGASAGDESPQISSGEGPQYRISSAESGDLADFTGLISEENSDSGEEAEADNSAWKTTWSVIREVGETIILTLIIFFLIQMVVRNFRVVGTSMVNNLHDGQYLIIDKVSYSPWVTDYLGLGGPQRGDVVVFEPPRRPEEDYVKRVIGLPGETVQVIKGVVYINDEALPEPFQPTAGSYTMPQPVTVPDGQVFVLGDNRNNSNDSHNWGPLPVENIVGRAWLSYWPPDLWGTIPRDAPSEEATLKHWVTQVIPSANAKSE